MALDKEDKMLRNSGIEMDPEDMTQKIDLEELNDEAVQLAMEMVDNLSNVYWDKTFMNEHPYLKKRIDFAIESMRLLIKNRKTNEKLHDLLLNSIQSNPANASLYRAQTQNTMALLSIQKQIDDTIASLNTMMKGFQLELNFNQQMNSAQIDGDDIPLTSVHRGSKTFIEEMKQKNQAEQTSLDLDEINSQMLEPEENNMFEE